MHPLVELYVPCVEFIAQTIGPHCEVLLYDFTDMDHSIVAISKNSLTGREVGGPITEFALSILMNPEHQKRDYITNYTGKSNQPDQVFRSSTLFIKDESRRIVGMLCVNIDVSGLQRACQILEDFTMPGFVHASPLEGLTPRTHERFLPSAEDLLQDIIQTTSSLFDVPPGRMNLSDRKNFVSQLSNQGCFLLKGGVTAAADCLGISEQTVYRYLKELPTAESS